MNEEKKERKNRRKKLMHNSYDVIVLRERIYMLVYTRELFYMAILDKCHDMRSLRMGCVV